MEDLVLTVYVRRPSLLHCSIKRILTYTSISNSSILIHTNAISALHSFYKRMTNRNVNTELCIIELKVAYQKENNTI